MAGFGATPQVEADRRLLQFATYEDYLDSLVTPQDHCYLQNTQVSRTLAELGYRSSGETLSKEQYEKRLAAVIAYLYPTFKPYELASEGLVLVDPIHQQLALRERPNRLGVMSTIIFLRNNTKAGFEVSGYIDYSERLSLEDWKPFFKGAKKIWPRTDDLGFYHWRSGKITINDSKNYKVIIHPDLGILFQNRYDRKMVCVDPAASAGFNSMRTRVHTTIYNQAVLYDHIIMQRK